MLTYVVLVNLSRSLHHLMGVPMPFPTLDYWKLQSIGSFAVVDFPKIEWIENKNFAFLSEIKQKCHHNFNVSYC